MSIGLVRRPDQEGRRCAKGEVALKFVVKVNVARVVRMLCKKNHISPAVLWICFSLGFSFWEI